MEGVTTLAWVKRHTPRVHTLALSEWPDAALAYRAFRAGARAFEHRDADPALLPRMVKALLAGDYFGDPYLKSCLEGVGKPPPERRLTSKERMGLFTDKGRVVFEYLLRHPNITRECMARRFNMKLDTLKSRLSKLYRNCGAPDRAGLIHWVARRGHPSAEVPAP